MMLVPVPPEFVPFVNQMVATRTFTSPDAVIFEALRQLHSEYVKLEELKQSLAEAIAELDRGEGTPLDFDEIKAKIRHQFSDSHPELRGWE